MKRTLQDAVNQPIEQTSVMGWGRQHLSATLLRDMLNFALRKYNTERFALAVDVETANVINDRGVGTIALGENYRPAVQDGSRIGAYIAYDMHVIGVPCNQNYLVVFALAEDDTVIGQITTALVPAAQQVVEVPNVTLNNYRALNGQFQE